MGTTKIKIRERVQDAILSVYTEEFGDYRLSSECYHNELGSALS